MAEYNRCVQRGNGRGVRVDLPEILGPFPHPEGACRERIHPARRRNQAGGIRLYRETENTDEDQAQQFQP